MFVVYVCFITVATYCCCFSSVVSCFKCSVKYEKEPLLLKIVSQHSIQLYILVKVQLRSPGMLVRPPEVAWVSAQTSDHFSYQRIAVCEEVYGSYHRLVAESVAVVDFQSQHRQVFSQLAMDCEDSRQLALGFLILLHAGIGPFLIKVPKNIVPWTVFLKCFFPISFLVGKDIAVCMNTYKFITEP